MKVTKISMLNSNEKCSFGNLKKKVSQIFLQKLEYFLASKKLENSALFMFYLIYVLPFEHSTFCHSTFCTGANTAGFTDGETVVFLYFRKDAY